MYRILTIVLLIGLAGCRSNGLVVETVIDYGNPKSNLPNSHAHGDGFIRALLTDSTEWKVIGRSLTGGRAETGDAVSPQRGSECKQRKADEKIR